MTAVRPGTVTITATSEGVSGTARIRIVAADLARIVDSIRQAFGLPGMGGSIVTRDGGVVGAGWGPTTAAGNIDQPVGHSKSGSSWIPCGGCDNRAGLSAAGIAHMPLAGWGRIIQEIIRGVDGLSPIMSQNTARSLFLGGVPIGNGGNYTHGWTVTQAGNAGLYAGDDGSNTTNHSRGIIFVDAGLAYLMTINTADLGPNGTGLALTALQQRLQLYRQTGQ